MQDKNQLIESAYSDFQSLKSIHQRFIEEIQIQEKNQQGVVSLKAEGESLNFTYFGLEFKAIRRSIASNGSLVANEYAFFGKIDNKDQLLSCLYLERFGTLYHTSSLDDSNRLCDFNNTYVVKNICSKLQLAALMSPFFEPRDINANAR